MNSPLGPIVLKNSLVRLRSAIFESRRPDRPEVTKRSSDTHKRTKQEHEARSVRETKGFQPLSGLLGIGDADTPRHHPADRRKSITYCFL